MNLPENAVRKGLNNPKKAVEHINNNILNKYKLVQFIDSSFLSHRWDDIYDYEWDLVIILDGCRYDLAQDTNTHIFEDDSLKSAYSVGSCSSEWVRRTFSDVSDSLLSETAYISGNHHTEYDHLKELGHIEKVWKYGWDDSRGTIPPRIVTDRAIDLMRDNIADRYIVHYMQPHLPPIGKASYDGQGFTPDEGWIKGNPWKRIKKGELDPEPVIDSYEKNIVPVLEEVEILLHNVNANKAIVTSDHGNYLGENGKWGHPPGQLHDAVRTVPWLETSAINQGTHEPAEYDLEDHKTDRQEQLKAMGYL